MKKSNALLMTALALIAAGCGDKTDVQSKAAAAKQEAVQKVQEAVQQVKTEVAEKVQEPAKKAVEEAAKAVQEKTEAVAETTRKTAATVKQETEQALASTVEHARQVTKYEETRSRSKAKKAEDELNELDRKQ